MKFLGTISGMRIEDRKLRSHILIEKGIQGGLQISCGMHGRHMYS